MKYSYCESDINLITEWGAGEAEDPLGQDGNTSGHEEKSCQSSRQAEGSASGPSPENKNANYLRCQEGDKDHAQALAFPDLNRYEPYWSSDSLRKAKFFSGSHCQRIMASSIVTVDYSIVSGRLWAREIYLEQGLIWPWKISWVEL